MAYEWESLHFINLKPIIKTIEKIIEISRYDHKNGWVKDTRGSLKCSEKEIEQNHSFQCAQFFLNDQILMLKRTPTALVFHQSSSNIGEPWFFYASPESDPNKNRYLCDLIESSPYKNSMWIEINAFIDRRRRRRKIIKSKQESYNEDVPLCLTHIIFYFISFERNSMPTHAHFHS